MVNKVYENSIQPLVSICCLTYNHENTIRQALDSMICQKTDFPFEIILHDDASTDSTADVIREYAEKYPDIVKPIIQTENQMKKCNIEKTYICPAVRGKYVAICEGDDFWTDENKLQIQTDFMRNNPDYTLCFHAVSQLNSDGTVMQYRPLKCDGEVPCDLIIKRGGMFCPSASLFMRADIFADWPKFRDMADVYDYPRQILSAYKGKVHYIDKIMATYRYESSGSWTAQAHKKTDLAHVQNETDWLLEFNKYSGGEFESAVNYHMAHLWFTEYRKNLSKSAKKEAKKYIKELSFNEGLVFRLFLVMFAIFGEKTNKLWELLKRTILK